MVSLFTLRNHDPNTITQRRLSNHHLQQPSIRRHLETNHMEANDPHHSYPDPKSNSLLQASQRHQFLVAIHEHDLLGQNLNLQAYQSFQQTDMK